jgi:hypothetical protein
MTAEIRRQRIVQLELELRAEVKRAIGTHGRQWLRAEVPLGYTHDHVAAGRDPGMRMETVQAELGALRRAARVVIAQARGSRVVSGSLFADALQDLEVILGEHG